MRRAPAFRLLACAAIAASFACHPSVAAADPNGVPVCTAAGDQLRPVTVSDAQGGAVVVWHDERPGSPAGGLCYAQRVNAAGAPVWTLDGVALCTTGDVNDPVAVGDGGGGAYVAFGGQGSAPRLQWINSAGVPQWGADGLTLSSATTAARELTIARDFGGGGDILVAWRQDNAASSDIFGQKVSSTGVLQWNPGGQALETLTDNETLPAIVSDGAGGAVLAWVTSAGGVRAMGFKSNGVGAWSRTPLSTTANNMGLSIVPDGTGGAIIGWGGGGSYAQRVSSLGTKEWNPTSTGVLLSSGGNMTNLLGDGTGGATAVWQDFRSTTNYNVYVQRLRNDGVQLWGTNGAAVCTATQDQNLPQIVSDGSNGSIITWFDYRFSNATGADIYAQHLDATSAAQWIADGIPLCAATGAQEYPTIATDGAGGAFVAWQDHRSGTNYDIYLQRVSPAGSTLAVPGSDGTTARLEAWPNPFSDRVQLDFALPSPARVRETVVDVAGRTVRDLGSVALAGGAHQLRWDGRTHAGRPADAGIYFLRVTAPGLELSRRVIRLK
ncbi:MAG TPA: FlgD immunoglobulin-like domain containing protein [Gemmatimonadales bacterium]|nr:FlgD immunoglobulin-like domain containing protein [Gemmatimonadales bacterium]